MKRCARVTSCDRCGAPSITAAADSSDADARLCGPCGHAWLLAVLSDWDASLLVWLGTATPEQIAEHIERVQARDLEAAERELRNAERRAKEANRKREAAERADREAHDRSRQILQLVTDQPRTRAELCDALGLSVRTLGRAISHAQRNGYVKTRTGPGSLVEAAQRN